jgi:hypothetical protein
MIAIGIIDPYSGQFINRAPGPNDMAAAQFDISNVGGSTSGTYYFSANLPTISGYSYVSPAQSPLAPGSHVINTLRWSEPNPAGGTFSVSLSGGKDSNGGNNYASQWIGSNYNQYQYQYAPQPVYYPQYTY